ncbi:NUDIX domain-containing protein [Caloranaerobacter sp. TR13]|uniref:NUDIX domain-containing protein n=1 Tax=Caloranaerobacter sp. TR13 TaxID=1302151 RepID=UPI0006D40EFC|nr:NUDIX domain-containing protein [Caloranaerobacter sp. TR13]
MSDSLEKVTAFITRERKGEIDLLLFKHPNVGIQILAGTVESEENHLDAVTRETAEEAGLPVIVYSQDEWIDYVVNDLEYTFK